MEGGWGGVSCENKTGISKKYLGDLNCKLLLFCNLVKMIIGDVVFWNN